MLKVLALSLILTSSIFAINLSVQGEITGIFDNQEAIHGPATSETLFGNLNSIGVGITLDSNSSIMGGVFFKQEFGATYLSDIRPLIYYRYKTEIRNFLFGSFIRKNEVDFSEYLISILYDFHNPLQEGFLYRRQKGNFSYTILGDWLGRETETVFEQFLVGCTGGGKTNHFEAGWEFLYNHQASRVGQRDSIRDHSALKAAVGFKQDSLAVFHDIKATLNGLLSFSRNRKISMEYDTPAGLELELSTKFKQFGVAYSHYHLLYQSSNSSHQIPTGEILYSAPFFNRVDLFVEPIKSDKVSMEITVSFIFVEGEMDSRQSLFITVPFFIKNTDRDSFNQ